MNTLDPWTVTESARSIHLYGRVPDQTLMDNCICVPGRAKHPCISTPSDTEIGLDILFVTYHLMRRKSAKLKFRACRKKIASRCRIIAAALWLLLPFEVVAQTTDMVVLNAEQMTRLRTVMAQNVKAKNLYDSVAALTRQHLTSNPLPVEVIHYEGLLDTDPKRIETTKSLTDMDKVVNLVYSYYGRPEPIFAERAVKFVLAWAKTYKPTGNTINENKLVPLFWAYHVFGNTFSADESALVQKWMRSIAQAQMDRLKTPMNNWEAKRLKIIAAVGCILDDDGLKTLSLQGIKNYIRNAYFPDGTSNDLRERDALSYHVSGLTPCIALFATCGRFDKRFHLFDYEAPSGASIRKAVEYTRPYATGEESRKEWVNTKVDLDKRRAAAGIAEYQPGLMFDPAKAVPMLEWACYFDARWCEVISSSHKGKYRATWVGMLNSPLIRQ